MSSWSRAGSKPLLLLAFLRLQLSPAHASIDDVGFFRGHTPGADLDQPRPVIGVKDAGPLERKISVGHLEPELSLVGVRRFGCGSVPEQEIMARDVTTFA